MTAAYGADSGRAPGGLINVVTKSRTNQIHDCASLSRIDFGDNPAPKAFIKERSGMNFYF